MIWASLAAGNVGSRGKKRPAGPLHRDHRRQEVDAALCEQDDHHVGADALPGEPVGDGRAPTRELPVTEPNLAGRDCHGVRRALGLLGEPFGESAEAAEIGLGAVPIDKDTPAFPRRQQRQREIRSSGLATTASSKVRRCAAIRVIVAASKRSVLYSNQPSRRSSASKSSSVRSNRAMPGSKSTKFTDTSRKRRGSRRARFAE